MKKTTIATVIVLSLGASIAQAATMTSATFTLFDPTGPVVSSDPTITGSIGDGVWSVATTISFKGALWTTHGSTTFGPGTY